MDKYINELRNVTKNYMVSRYSLPNMQSDADARKNVISSMLEYFLPNELKEVIERYLELNDIEYIIKW